MNLDEEAAEWLRVGTLVAIWVAVLYFSRTPLTISWGAIAQLPAVISIYAIVTYVFTHWLWRWHFLQGWLVPLPDVRGTWQGEIHSTWRDACGQELPPIPVVLVIKQTFLSVNCVLHSRDSDSYSMAAQIRRDDAGTFRLTYNYMSRPRAAVRDRVPIHDGAAILRVVGRGRHAWLEGEYWTNRHTTGDMRLHFRSRAILDDFPGVTPAPRQNLLRGGKGAIAKS
jgi:SMODS-associating 2TM, beta-strand rich effector domain